MTSPRPRLLFLSQTLPYPLDAGVKVRTYHILRLLAQHFDITALCFYRREASTMAGPAEALRALGAFGHIEAFPIEQEHSRVRFVLDHLRSLVTGRVYTVATYSSSRFRRRLREWLRAGSFDLVHADSLDLSGYFELVRSIPTVCVHHDVQSSLLARRAQHANGPLARLYLSLQAKLMGREERTWLPRVALNVAVSAVDQARINDLVPGAVTAVVPNGADTDFLRPHPDGERAGLVFIGGSGWLPNLDGMRYFCEAILPALRRLGCDPPVTWIGSVTAGEKHEFATRYGVKLLGRVEDFRGLVAKAACCIVPLRIGGGTRIKILDAWAMGKAVVSTTLGAEGLAAIDGQNCLIRDDPGEFALAIKELLEQPARQALLEGNARATAESRYAWEVVGREMVERYLALTTRDSATGAADLGNAAAKSATRRVS